MRNTLLKLLYDNHQIPHDCPKPSKFQLILWTLRYRMASQGFPLTNNEQQLNTFHNKHKGKRAFIMGNGPSLNAYDLSPLKNEITFGVNSIFLNYEISGFHPTYYVVEDVYVAEDRAKQINQYHEPEARFFGNYLRYVIEDSPNTYWLNVFFNYSNYANFPNFGQSALRGVWVGGTVSYICMQLAYYMGFKEVYLIGFDHSYHIPNSAKVEGNKIVSQENDPNHFHPDYFGKGYRWHDPMVDRMEQSYRRTKEVFEKDNRHIYNATAGGHLEIFERVSFQDLF